MYKILFSDSISRPHDVPFLGSMSSRIHRAVFPPRKTDITTS